MNRPGIGVRRRACGRHTAALLCMLALNQAAPPAAAQQAAGIQFLSNLSLEELSQLQVRSASKQLEPSILAPGSVYVLRTGEIKRFGLHTLQDALQIVPSVYLYDPHSWVWGGQRGLVSNFSQTLLLVNGREVNNLIALEGFISRQFATHNVDRIEVVAGPGSALYGANALAGVINIVSRQLDPDFDAIEIRAEAGSFNRRAVALTFGKRVASGTRLSGSLRYFESDEANYSDFISDQTQFLRGWEDAAVAARVLTEYRNPSQAATWELQLDHGDFYAGTFGYYNRHSQGLEELSWSYTDNQDHRRFELYYAGLDHALSDAIDVKLEYQHVRSFLWGRYFGGLWPGARLEAPEDTGVFEFPNQVTTSTGVMLEGEAAYRNFYPSFAHYLLDQDILDPQSVTSADIHRYFTHLYTNRNSGGSRRNRLDLEAEWRPDDASSVVAGLSLDLIDYVGLAVTDGAIGIGADFALGLDPAGRQPVYASRKYGAFVQYKRQIESPNLWFTFGVRLDHQNHYGSSVNPRASVIWQPRQGTLLEASYAEAFREPNVFELAGDPSIDPAVMQSYELSVNQLLSERATFQVTVFRNEVENFLGSVSSLIGTGNASIDSQTIQGMEFQLDGALSDWCFLFNGAYVFDARQKALAGGGSSTLEVLGIPGTRFNLGVTRSFAEWEASLLWRFQRRYRALSGNLNVTEPIVIPSTRELNLIVNSPAATIMGAEWQASLQIRNLLDRRNFDANIRRSGTHQFLQDGRSFVLSATAKF